MLTILSLTYFIIKYLFLILNNIENYIDQIFMNYMLFMSLQYDFHINPITLHYNK